MICKLNLLWCSCSFVIGSYGLNLFYINVIYRQGLIHTDLIPNNPLAMYTVSLRKCRLTFNVHQHYKLCGEIASLFFIAISNYLQLRRQAIRNQKRSVNTRTTELQACKNHCRKYELNIHTALSYLSYNYV